ncbi:MAG: SRPBCC domain-containing protein [Afipia sp.]|nr:SRPBCC domain-containing protein [Afipia sp.]
MASTQSAAIAETFSKEFVIERLFDAPRDLVWKVFTERDHLMKWWGPKGFKMIAGKLDLKPGGIFHYGMEAPDGSEMWGKWVFREIVKPERLVFVSSFSDKEAALTRHPMAPTWPIEMLGTATFIDQGGKTLLVNHVVALNATDEERATFEGGFGSMKQGYGGTWDQLAAYLASLQF